MGELRLIMLRVPQKLDYAIRTLVLLAMQPADSYTSAGDLADRLSLPRRFVEQQITVLSREGIVSCRRGPSGGCALIAAPKDVTVLDIVVALEGVATDIPRQPGSAPALMWGGMAEAIEDYLGSVTLEELVENQRRLDEEAVPMYYI